jgi:phosphoribosylglycinamide formyltransferase-1
LNAARPIRLAILGSGKGSNAVALIDACRRNEIPASVALILSDVADAGILARAREHSVPGEHFDPGPFRTKLAETAEAALIERLQQAGVDYVVLAGFMRILKGPLLRAFPHRVLNIHPSLLPAFPGLNAWEQALDHGVKITGCTVHFVEQSVDSGPILAQAMVPVRDDDTPAALHARIQEAEHRLYPAVVAALARGEIRIEGRRTRGFSGRP